MATNEVRVYAVVFADFAVGAVSEDDWIALMAAAKDKPLSAAILEAARYRSDGAQSYITARKRSQNAAHLLLYTMLGFEMDRDDVDPLLSVLDAEAATHGVTGTVRDKLTGVLQAELRAAAADLGYGAVAQSKLSVTLLNEAIPATFTRENAIAQAQAYLATNTAIWYA